MIITTAWVDCLLVANSTGGYNDFQHHQWAIGPSGQQISSATGNYAKYTWSLSGGGGNNSASWNVPPQSMSSFTNTANITKPLQLEVRLDTSLNKITLTQDTPLSHQLQAFGNPKSQNHPVDELVFPDDLSLMANTMPGPTSHSDPGGPTFTAQLDPKQPLVAVPTGSTAPMTVVANLILNYDTFSVGLGSGGRPWLNKNATLWQMPTTGSTALAWWSWTINLAP